MKHLIFLFFTIAVTAGYTQPDSATTKINPKDGLTYIYIATGTFLMGCTLKSKLRNKNYDATF